MPSVTPLTHHNTRRHDGGIFASVSQSAEKRFCKPKREGSIPSASS